MEVQLGVSQREAEVPFPSDPRIHLAIVTGDVRDRAFTSIRMGGLGALVSP